MGEQDKLYLVLDYILNQATSRELEVIGEALKRRTSSPAKGPGGMDIRGMARRLAGSIEEQLGSSLNVRNISRKIVGDLIRQKQPGISEQELKDLLDRYLPAESPPGAGKPGGIPPDVLITMITQYLDDKLGRLSPKERQELPPDWSQRYWEAFPSALKQRIGELLSGRISEGQFWEQTVKTLGQ